MRVKNKRNCDAIIITYVDDTTTFWHYFLIEPISAESIAPTLLNHVAYTEVQLWDFFFKQVNWEFRYKEESAHFYLAQAQSSCGHYGKVRIVWDFFFFFF